MPLSLWLHNFYTYNKIDDVRDGCAATGYKTVTMFLLFYESLYHCICLCRA